MLETRWKTNVLSSHKTGPRLALSVVSQFMHNPGEQHMNAVICILRYLKSAIGKGIIFFKNTNKQNI